MFLSTWRHLAQKARRNGLLTKAGQGIAANIRKWPLLWLEQLEDRTVPSTFQWTGGVGASTNWADMANWNLVSGTSTQGFPNAVGDVAQFTGNFSASTVTLNQSITVGEIDFGSATGISITGPSGKVLTLDNAGFGATSFVNLLPANSGADLINAPVQTFATPLAASILGGSLQLNNSGVPANTFASGSTFAVGSGGTLSVTGGANTGTAGITVNSGGTLYVAGSGTLASTPTLTVYAGGTFTVDDNTLGQLPGGGGRFNPTSNFVLNGGTFSYIGNTAGSSDSTLPVINLASGNSIIASTPTGTGVVQLASAKLVRQPGATVTFTGPGLGTTSNEILFNAAPDLLGSSSVKHIGFLPYASVNGTDFATYLNPANNSNDPSIFGIGAFNDYAASIASSQPGDVVKETNPEVLTANATIAGLVLTGNSTVAQAGFGLTIGANSLTSGTTNTEYGGSILNLNVLGGTISGGTLAFAGSHEGVILNGELAGGLAANFYNLSFTNANGTYSINASGRTGFGGGILGSFGQFNYNTLPTAQRVDPDINYGGANGPVGNGGTSGGLISAGGNGQPSSANPPGVVLPNVALQWSGNLNIVTGGVYNIINSAVDDATRTYIDGQLLNYGSYNQDSLGNGLIGNNTSNAAGQDGFVYASSINLTPGLHSILVQYYNSAGATQEVIDYQGPDTNNQLEIIPGAASLTSPGFIAPGQLNLFSALAASSSLTLSGGQVDMPTANSYTGTTYINGAIVNVGNAQSLGVGTLSLVAATLQSNSSVTLANPYALNNASVSFFSTNNLTLSGTGTLTGAVTLVNNSSAQTNITGQITGSGNLTVTQLGQPALNAPQGLGSVAITNGTNNYTGGTVIAAGGVVVAATTSNATPFGTGTLTLSGGTLYSSAQAQTVSNPVVLNGSLTLAPSTYGAVVSSSNPTISSSASSLNFTGPAVIAGPTTLNLLGTATFSGVVSGAGALTVTGQGTLTLAGANTYSGGTTLNAGSYGAFGTLNIGTSTSLGTGRLTLISGAIIANNAAVTVANPVSFAPVVSGTNGVNLVTGCFIAFGGQNQNAGQQGAAITFTNSAVNTISGSANLIVNTPTTFNMPISDGTLTVGGSTSGTLVLYSGTSNLTLQANDTFSGAAIVNSGTLTLSGGGQLSASSGFTVNTNAILVVDDKTSTNLANRLNPNASGLTLNGGTLSVLGNSGKNSTESFQSITLASGNSIISLSATGSGGTATVAGTLLVRDPGATVNFQAAAGQTFGSSGADQVSFASQTAFDGPLSTSLTVNGIIPYATVTDSTATTTGGNTSGYNFATYAAGSIVAYTAYTTTALLNGSDANDNVLVTASYKLTASDTFNSVLLVGDGITLSGTNLQTALTVNSGAVASNDPVAANPTGNTISVATLAFTTAEGLVFTNKGSDTISSNITGTNGLTMGGLGNIILPSPNSYSSSSFSAESQVINISGMPTGGTYTLSYGGATTSPIQFNAPTTGTGSVLVALQALPALGGNVSVTGAPGASYNVTFGGSLAGQILPLLVVSNIALAGGVNSVVAVSINQPGTSTTAFNGGTLTLGTNTAIQQGLTVTSGTIQALGSVALTGAVSLGATSSFIVPASSNITIAGGNPVDFAGGLVLNGLTDTITVAQGTPALVSGTIGDNPLSTSTTALIKSGTGTLTLTGGNSYVGTTWIQQGIVNVQNGSALGSAGNQVENINFQGSYTGGLNSTFTLTFNGATTGPIPWTNIVSTVVGYIQGALDTLPTVGAGNVVVNVVAGSAFSTTGGSNNVTFTFAFQNQLSSQLLPLITVNTQGLAGAATITYAIPTVGNSAAQVAIGTAGLPATLQLQGANTSPQYYSPTIANRFTIAGSGVTPAGSTAPLGAIDSFFGNNVMSGAINVYSAATIAGSYPLILSGDISGGGDLTKISSGILTFSGQNGSFTGGLNVAGGMLESGLGSFQGNATTANNAFLYYGDYATVFGNNVSSINVENGATLGVGAGADIDGKALTIIGIGYSSQQGYITGNQAEATPIGAFIANPFAQGTTWSGDITLAGNATVNASNYVYGTSENSNAGQSGPNPLYPFIITGSIGDAGKGYSLTKVGGATLDLWGANTYTGATYVAGGPLTLGFSGALASPSVYLKSGPIPSEGGVFTFDDTGEVVANRLTSTSNLVLDGGIFTLLPNNIPGVATTAIFGNITVGVGFNTFTTGIGTGVGCSTTVTVLGTLIPTYGATVYFSAITTGQSNNLLIFDNPPTLVNGILPYGTVSSANPAPYTWASTQPANILGSPNAVSLVGFNNFVNGFANATATSNVLVVASATLSSNVTVNSILVSATSTLTLNAASTQYTLTVASGGILANGNATFNGGTLNFGTAEGRLEGNLTTYTITSIIAGSGGLTLADPYNSAAVANIVLGVAGGSANTYTGPAGLPATNLASAYLQPNNVGALGSGPLFLYSGQIGGGTTGGQYTITNPVQFYDSDINVGDITFAGPVTLTDTPGFFNELACYDAPSNATNSNGAATVITGVISGTGGLALFYGGGPLLITNGNNTYSGGTLIGGQASGVAVPNLEVLASGTAQNSVQSIGISGSPTSGSFTLSFDNLTTAPITYSSVGTALQTAIQNALNGLSSIGTGNTLVGLPATSAGVVSVSVTFQNTFSAATQPLLGFQPALNAGSIAVTSVLAGGVVSGPLGTGPLYLFGAGSHYGLSDSGGLAGVIAASNYVNGGTNSNNADNPALYVQPLVNIPNQLILQSASVTVGGGGAYDGGGNIQFSGPILVQGTSDLNITANESVTLSGQITGDGGLLFLSNANYTGTLAITGNNSTWSGGFVQSNNNTTIIGNSNALGTGLVDINKGLLQDDGKGGAAGYVLANQLELDGAGPNQIAVTTASSPLTLTGLITGTGVLQKVGPGTLFITNIDAAGGATTVQGGNLVLNQGGDIVASTSITVGTAATLTLDNSFSTTIGSTTTFFNSGNRISDIIPITLAGGTFSFIGSNQPNVASSETIGNVTLNAGQNTISSTESAAAGATSVLTIGSITANSAGALLNFVGVGGSLGTGANQISVLGAIQNTGGTAQIIQVNTYTGGSGTASTGYIIPFATVTSSPAGTLDFATTVGGTPLAPTNIAPYNIAAFTGYLTGGLASSTSPSDVVKLQASDGAADSVANPQTVAAVLLSGDGVAVSGAGTLAVSTGAIAATPVISASNTATGTVGDNISAGLSFSSQGYITTNSSLAQALSFTGGPTGGTFSLIFNGQTAAGISYSATGATLQGNIQTALGKLANVGGAGNVLVGGNSNGTFVTVTFQGALGGMPQPMISAISSTLTGGSNVAVTVATNPGLVLSGAETGTNGLTLGGTGLLTLGGANTFAAGSFITSGTVAIGNASAFGAAGNALTITGGGLQSSVSAGVTLPNSVALSMATGNSGTGNQNLLPFVNQSFTFSGPFPLSLSGVISGNGGITVNSPSTLTLTGATANTFIGSSTVTGGGTLVFGKTAIVNGLVGPLFIGTGSLSSQQGTAVETGFSNQLDSQNILIDGSGSALVLGNLNAAIGLLSFTDGGAVELTTGAITVNGNIVTQSTNGQVSTASILGGTLTYGGNRVITVASSGGTPSSPSGPTEAIVFSGGPTGGNFALAFGGATTANIAFSTTATALASNIQSALQALSTIGTTTTGAFFATVAGTSVSGQIIATVTFPNQPPGTVLSQLIQVNAAPVNTVQQLNFPGGLTGGTFTVSFNGATSAPINYSTTAGASSVPGTLASNIQAALASLSTLGAGNTVENLAFSASTASGTFELAYGASTTAPIAYSATASTLQSNIQNALNALASIAIVNGTPTNTTDVSVSAVSATSVNVTFQNALGGINATLLSVPPAGNTLSGITITPTKPTTGAASTANLFTVSAVSSSTVNVTFQGADGGGALSSSLSVGGTGASTNAQYTLAIPTGFTAGTFTLTVGGQVTAPITYSGTATALASNIQAAVGALTSIGSGNVSVSASGSPLIATITFTGAKAATNVGTITASGVGNGLQTIVFPAGTTGGAFTLSYNSATTAPIAYSTAAATLQTNIQNALNTLATLGAVNDVQTINFTGTPAGTFTLIYGAQTTTAITYSSVAATLQANIFNALEGLTSINSAGGVASNSVNVAVGGTAAAPTVTFQNALGGAPQAVLSFSGTGLTSGSITSVSHTTTGAPFAGSTLNAVVSAASNTSVNVSFQGTVVPTNVGTLIASGTPSNAQQELGFSGVTGGTFSLTYSGQTASGIAYSTTATTLAANILGALGSLSSIGLGNVAVSVSGSPEVATVTFLNGTSQSANPIAITGTAAVNGVQTLSFPANLTGGNFTLAYTSPAGPVFTTNPIAYSATPATLASNVANGLNAAIGDNAVQTISFSSNATGGNFTLAFGSPAQTTGNISYSTAASTLQANILNALTALAGIGVNNNNIQVSAASASSVTVFFYNSLGQTNLATMTTTSALAPSGATVSVATTTAGNSTPAVSVSAASATSVTVNFVGTLAGGNVLSPLATNGVTGVAALNAVQNITLPSGVTGGTFTLAFTNSQGVAATTSAISYSPTVGILQSNIQSALNTLLGTTGGNPNALVQVTTPTSVNVTFQNALGNAPQNTMTGSGASVTAMQAVNFTGVTGGTFTLGFGSQTTAAITYSTNPGALQANIQNALNSLSFGSGASAITLGSGNTVVVVNATATTATIGFQNALAGSGVPIFTFNNVNLAGTSPAGSITNIFTGQGLLPNANQAITVSTTTAGNAGGLLGLLGGNSQIINVNATFGSGLTGVSLSPFVINPTTVGGQGGLSGGGAGVAVAATLNNFVVGGQGGLLPSAGGQAITVVTTTPGFGLSSGTAALGTVTTGTAFVGDLTISSLITGAGNNALIKSGPGVLALTGSVANTITDTLAVDAGSLVLAMQNPVNAYGGILDINSFNAAAPATVYIGSNNVQLNPTTGVIVNGPNATLDTGSLVTRTTTQTILTLEVRGGTVKTGSQTLDLSSNLIGMPGAMPNGVQTGTISGNLALTATAPQNVTVQDVSGVPGLTISALISGAGAINKLGAGTLVLAGTTSNTYTGGTTVADGTLALMSPIVTLSDSSTSSTGGTFVLSLNGSTVAPQTVNYTNNTGTLQSNIQTALNNLVGAGNATVSVASASSATITFLSGALVNGALPTLLVASSLNTGTLSTSVPTLIPAGTVTVGDGAGGSSANKADILQINSTGSQISTTAVLTVNNSGLLNLNGSNQTVSSLALIGNTIATGTAGTLTLNGNITSTANIANQTPATISGNLALNGAVRNVDVQQGSLPGGQPDMVISAVISGNSLSGLTKTNSSGVLDLTGVNTYLGPTTVTAGTLLVDGSLSQQSVNAVSTLTFGGTVTGGTFTLTFNGQTTAAIPYSSVASTLQTAIQAALNALTNIGGLANAGPLNAVVSAASATSVTVTFVNLLGGLPESLGEASSLQGSSPSLSVASTTTGITSTVSVSGTGVLGGIGTTGPVTATAGGSVNPGSPATGIGILTINNSTGEAGTTAALNLTNGGNLTLEISGNPGATGYAAGVNFDQVKLTGQGILQLGGTSTLTLDLAGLTNEGTIDKAIIYSGVVGQFSSISTINNPFGLVPVVYYNAGELDVSFAGPATHFAITGNSSTVAGQQYTITVTALDQFNLPALSYAGTVQFSTSDTYNNPGTTPSHALLPASYTFTSSNTPATDNGVHVFTGGVTLITAGLQTITATDSLNNTITGSEAVTVNPGVATQFKVTAPSTVTAGHFLVLAVAAEDQYGNIATNYHGTDTLTSSDAQATLADPSTLTGGVGSFAVLLETAGPQTVTVSDKANNITGISTPTTTVAPGAFTKFAVSAQATVSPGTPFTVTVTALDKFGNVINGLNGTTPYTGAMKLTTSDLGVGAQPTQAAPLNYTFVAADAGMHTFTNSVTLVSAPSQTITATDVSTGLGGSTTVALVAATVKGFVISAPGATAAGFPFTFGVVAVDQFGNTVTNYTGTVHFSSSDSQPALPADATLTNGAGFFGALLRTAGNQTITVTDKNAAGITTTSGFISVTGLAASRLAITAPATAVTGSSFPVTVKAEDQFGNVYSAYTGTVHFTSSDPIAGLPANAPLTLGSATFTVTLNSPGTQTVSANDTVNPGIIGTSNTIATLGLVVKSLTPTSTGFIAVFNKPFDPTQINLYDSLGTYGPDDVLLTGPGSTQTSFHGSLIIDPSNQTITFVKTSTFTSSVNTFNPASGVLTAGTYTVTFRSATNGFVDLLGAPLDGTSSGNPAGSNFTTTFVVAATPTEVVGIPGFARGPNSAQSINLPNNLTFGIPLNLSNGNGVTSGKFTLQYNSALLSITGVTVNTGLTNATLTLDSASTAGSAVIDFSSSTALAAGVVRLGGLVATVPNSAAPLYTDKALLHWSSLSINGSSSGVTGDDAIEVNAYFGDAAGTGPLSGEDASLISRVATGLDNNPATGVLGGFAAFRLADSVLLGDLTSGGAVGAGAVTLMNSFLSGTPRPQIPTIPSGLTIPMNGVDPALSIPIDLQATAGGTVVVPVQIDSGRPQGSTGVTQAILAVQYDPAEFTVSAQDVQLGALPLSGSGWQLQTAIDAQTGQIGIDVFSTTGLQTTAGGTLVTIDLHVRENAPSGMAGINLVPAVNPTGSRPFVTSVSDAQGGMLLHTAETALGIMPGAPGEVTVAAAQSFVVGQFIARPLAEGSEQLALTSNDDCSSAPSSVHYPLSTASLEHVFADLAPMMLDQYSTLAQPAAILNSENDNQAIASIADQDILQRIGALQHDWVPDDLAAYLGQITKASRRLPLGDSLDGIDLNADLDGVEAFFARQAAPGGQP